MKPVDGPARVYVAPDGRSVTSQDTGEPAGYLVPVEDRSHLAPWPFPGDPPPGFYSAAVEGAVYLASKDKVRK